MTKRKSIKKIKCIMFRMVGYLNNDIWNKQKKNNKIKIATKTNQIAKSEDFKFSSKKIFIFPSFFNSS